MKSNYIKMEATKGYSWNKVHKKWVAKIRVNGKVIYLGLYNTEEEAHAAYLAEKTARNQQIEQLKQYYGMKTRNYAKGYTWHKGHQKWVAKICVSGKTIHLGYFDTEENAHAAYLASKAILF
tara:strand:- start:87 stop:452 length:366 start_codon:yes stop_codon:yes gene_type:complete